MDYAENAKSTFRHYFQTAFKAAGLKWDSDNDAEINDAVDMLLAAASERVRSENHEEDR